MSQGRFGTSAPDASTSWKLRCEVREKLIEHVRNTYPESLPKVRAEILEPSKDKPDSPKTF